MFDCVLPTRNARNGQLFTEHGKLNMRNAKWKNDFSPIDETTLSYASQNFTKAYLAHLFNSEEILGLTLTTMHNIAFYQKLVRTAREKILAGNFDEWKSEFILKYGRKANIAYD
jgi:queuine tRNA-ribosyltransferase